jgi:hypothetical protein
LQPIFCISYAAKGNGTLVLYLFKLAFISATNRTDPVIGYILKSGASLNPTVRITDAGIIDPTADQTFVFGQGWFC